MRIIGFNFNKISVEKLAESADEIKINTNIDVSSIEKSDFDLFERQEQEFLKILFKYTINYEPSLAIIEFEGSITLALDPKQAKELLKGWKNKDIPENIRIPLFNAIFRKSNIKALQLEDEMNLPPHVPLPRISPSQQIQQPIQELQKQPTQEPSKETKKDNKAQKKKKK